MPSVEIPQWVVNIVFLFVMWIIGIIMSEWIKKNVFKANKKIENPEYDRRKSSVLMIDQTMFQQFLKAFEEHTQTMQKLVVLMEQHKEVTGQTLEVLSAHINAEMDPLEKIKEIHQKLMGV